MPLGSGQPDEEIVVEFGVLGPLRVAEDEDVAVAVSAARIVARAPGYVIGPTEVDASRFEALARRAGAVAAAGRWAQAGQVADQALGLWRGAPLADVSSQSLIDRWVPYLEQARVQMLEWRIEASLHQGHHEQLIGEPRQLGT